VIETIVGGAIGAAVTLGAPALQRRWENRSAAANRRADIARDDLPGLRHLFAAFIKELRNLASCRGFETCEGDTAFAKYRDEADELATQARFIVREPTLNAMYDAMESAVLSAGLRDDARKSRDSGLGREAREAQQHYGNKRAAMIALMDGELVDLERRAGAKHEEIDAE
jgi:hypothetical protein